MTLIALGLAAAQFLARELLPGVPLTRTIAIGLVLTGLFVSLAGARRYAISARGIEE